jgi:hypothetical protein
VLRRIVVAAPLDVGKTRRGELHRGMVRPLISHLALDRRLPFLDRSCYL